MDSWSTRLTVQPGIDWSGQLSYARIASPESLFPSEDQARTTASLMYNRPLKRGNLANTLLWGRTRTLGDNVKENSYLFETTARFHRNNFAWTRIENAGRSNELLDNGTPLTSTFEEQSIGHVQAYTFGYDHEFRLGPHLRYALGSQVTAYGVPAVLRPAYGSDPAGFVLFLRLRPSSKKDR